MEIAGRRDAADARAGAARRSRPARSRASLSVAAVGRRAAAHRHRARAGQRSAADSRRRADRQSRQLERPPRARSAAAGAPLARRDAGDGDARSQRRGRGRRTPGAARWPAGGERLERASQRVSARESTMRFVLLMAAREMRASWQRLLFFFVCIAIGVGAIVALRSVIQSVRNTFAGEARSLITADAIIASNQALKPEVIAEDRRAAGGRRRREHALGRAGDDGAARRSRRWPGADGGTARRRAGLSVLRPA